MKKAKRKKPLPYPEETNGSKWAAENRKRCNGRWLRTPRGKMVFVKYKWYERDRFDDKTSDALTAAMLAPMKLTNKKLKLGYPAKYKKWENDLYPPSKPIKRSDIARVTFKNVDGDKFGKILIWKGKAIPVGPVEQIEKFIADLYKMLNKNKS